MRLSEYDIQKITEGFRYNDQTYLTLEKLGEALINDGEATEVTDTIYVYNDVEYEDFPDIADLILRDEFDIESYQWDDVKALIAIAEGSEEFQD